VRHARHCIIFLAVVAAILDDQEQRAGREHLDVWDHRAALAIQDLLAVQDRKDDKGSREC